MNSNYINLDIYFNKAIHLYNRNQRLLKLYTNTNDDYFLCHMIYNLNKCYNLYITNNNSIVIKNIFEQIKLQILNILITLTPDKYIYLINKIDN